MKGDDGHLLLLTNTAIPGFKIEHVLRIKGSVVWLDGRVLIDASGFIFRAYHAIQRPLTNPQGVPVAAVYGYIQMLLKQLDDLNPDHIGVIFDSARVTFRNEIAPEYKANRPEPPED